MENTEANIKGKLIKDALIIVEKISKFDSDEYDDEISLLISEAKKLSRNRFWKLK
jgi:hypothetical protein